MSETPFMTILATSMPIEAPPSTIATLTNLLALIEAAKKAAQHVCEGDPLAIDELREALAIAEISALRLSAEHALAGTC